MEEFYNTTFEVQSTTKNGILNEIDDIVQEEENIMLRIQEEILDEIDKEDAIWHNYESQFCEDNYHENELS